ncbi:MAG TPA: hypothetical protein VN698_15625 [Bacteroidia bacterium]|nr:hypothetical protein [Bacteroidia bacterium]
MAENNTNVTVRKDVPISSTDKNLQAIASAYKDIPLEPPLKAGTTILVTSLDKGTLYRNGIDYAVAHNGTSITILPHSAIEPIVSETGEEKPNILINYTA